MMIIATTSTAIGGTLCGCSEPKDGNAHYTDADKDLSVNIGDDFYAYSNGGWQKNHPLPADKSRQGTFDLLFDENQEHLKEIVDEVSSKENKPGSAAQQIADYYLSGMDTAQRNADGIKALVPYLEKVDKIENSSDISRTIGELQEMGVGALVVLTNDADAKNSDMSIAALFQTGIGLPDRDYYFSDDERSNTIKEAYKVMLGKYAEKLEWENVEERVNKVYAFEGKIAGIMYTRKQNRDPQALYNMVKCDNISSELPNFDWETYFKAIGIRPDSINASQKGYFEKMGSVINSTEIATVKDYLKLSIIRQNASFLSDDYVNIAFDFSGRVLSGVEEMKPLWKRVLSVVDGEQLGQLFVEKYFPPSAKTRMKELIENLRIAFAERIDNLTWMGDATKAKAKEKLAAIKVKVGYPDKWTDYSSLTIDRKLGFMGNVINDYKFSHKRMLSKIDKPVDKDEWYMTPQTVNAYYNPSGNEIVFPAGILQPPFFYAEGDDAVNYGAIGVVIGHEMTHGFDDQGCQFDKDGNLNNWWTDEDAERFKGATSKLVDRYASFTAVGDLKADGELTLGENIADLGGLNISYQAFRNAQKGVEPKEIDGQTADQRFCYAYSRVWATNVRDEYLFQQVKTDPHSPAHLRVNVPLPLVDYFYNAFGITDSCKMYVPKEDRIIIW
ncbi:MAG: M13 family metallopeptidase [Bacteroidales bacterium]|nr:M13 family metallopeptidase [Bacteroidales bacterium]